MKKIIKRIRTFLFFGLSPEEQCENAKKEHKAAVEKLIDNKAKLEIIKTI